MLIARDSAGIQSQLHEVQNANLPNFDHTVDTFCPFIRQLIQEEDDEEGNEDFDE